jgi:outer membrane cobalamin receptor
MSWHPAAHVFFNRRDEDLVRTIPLAPNLGDRQARALTNDAVGGSVDLDRTFDGTRPIALHVGGDIARESLETTYRPVDDAGTAGAIHGTADVNRTRGALFASGSWTASRVRVSAGIRHDLVDDGGVSGGADASQTHHAWSPRAGVSIQLSRDGETVLFTQVSRAFKAPTLDQLFDPRPYPDFRGGTFTVSNGNLVPQRATNAEAGVTGGRAVRWSVLAYRMNVDQEIDFDVQTFSYANIGRSRHTGLELEAEGRWWRRLQPSASYALTHVVDADEDSGAQLKNVPRHWVTAGAAVELPFAFGATARYSRTWEAFLDDANLFSIDARSRLDIRVRRAAGRHMLFVDVLNATNHVSEEYGFTLTDFRGRSVPYAYPSAPRTIRGGIRFAF